MQFTFSIDQPLTVSASTIPAKKPDMKPSPEFKDHKRGRPATRSTAAPNTEDANNKDDKGEKDEPLTQRGRKTTTNGDTARKTCTALLPSASPPSSCEGHAVLTDMATARRPAVLAAEIGQEANTLAQGARELHAAVDVAAAGSNGAPAASPVLEAQELVGDVREWAGAAHAEPRLIVEALVVRKLSIEEATLDFSRFSLV
ncbi:hypothetical protein NUW54_g12479 [Trametes sanguinea]|uniref:Uncharacterized protein n=1 Tax=Trametes sanguinea TaxID=158606 RepID=A0ACC1MX13_9APHY|nr:hypothetical protein NUW54_g12479 [Trametes sanguinea]